MVQVTSEIGRLHRVLVHAPEAEVDRMVPAMMEELLFDDILFGDRAREEHAIFRRLMKLMGIDVVESRDLLANALEDLEAREWLKRALPAEGGPQLQAQIHSAPAPELAALLIQGIPLPAHEVDASGEELYGLAPLPNWCFQRDPLIILGSGVVFGAMASRARQRESILHRLIFKFHPDFCSVPVILDPATGACLEGGDVLLLSADVVAVGHSQRTNRKGIEGLVGALAELETGPRWLLVVEIPKRRAYMHLDTLVTPVDRDCCLVFPPVILGRGSGAARVSRVDLRDRRRDAVGKDSFLAAASELGLELSPLRCGGPDPVAQHREQWTDGANALALAPGAITLYDRNVETAEELARNGFRVVRAIDVLLGKAEVELRGSNRLCILIPSHEMSRARGGPHCLTHPLLRDEP